MLLSGQAAALSRAYLCFFEQGSALLSDRSRMVVHEAAANWRRLHEGTAANYLQPGGPPLAAETDTLTATGHADDSPDDNGRLSLLRAEAVAAELRAQGVPAGNVRAVGRGADAPLVPDSPLDPQNRWVEIRFDRSPAPPT